MRELKEDKRILIQKPDKGSGVVLLEHDQYVSEMEELLSDRNKFRVITGKQPDLAVIEAEINELIKELIASGQLAVNNAWWLKPKGSNLPRLYGLPKIHKLPSTERQPTSIPMRPILSMINPRYHALSKWLCSYLSPLRDELCKHTVSDSYNFVRKLNKWTYLNVK